MLGDWQATSDRALLVRLDASDDKVCSSGCTLMMEWPTGSQEREPLAHLFKEKVEYVERDDDGEYEEGEGEGGGDEDESEVGKEEGERREEQDKAPNSSDDNYKPCILLKIWLMNDFLSKMSSDVFGRLHPRFQIPEDIPLRMTRKREKCYSSQMADVNFYKAIFIAGLRLLLSELH